eukprot:COSAG01_NODE_83377_length_100_cov_2202.000000_1_plen_28_part_10
MQKTKRTTSLVKNWLVADAPSTSVEEPC